MKENEYNFSVAYPPSDLGLWLYGTDISKTQYNAHKVELKSRLKSPVAIYLFAVCVFLLFWFFYSFIFALTGEDSRSAVLEFLPSFFVMAGCIAIILMSVFGVWGKFMRFAINARLVKTEDVDTVQDVIDSAEDNEGAENSLNIYKDYIEIKNFGKRIVLDRNLLQEVEITVNGSYCSIKFESVDGTDFCAYAEVPRSDIYKFKEIFGKQTVKVVGGRKKSGDSEESSETSINSKANGKKINGARVGGLFTGLICMAVGGGVIALHFCVAENIPWFFGLFFVLGGLLMSIINLASVPIFKIFIIPFLFGVIFILFPPWIFILLYTDGEGGMPWNSFGEFLTSFSPVGAIAVMLVTVGGLVLIYAFVSLIKYIRYGLD